jgi:hypothetical protein
MGAEKDKNNKNDEESGVGVLGGVRIMSDKIERSGINKEGINKEGINEEGINEEGMNEEGRGVLVLRGVGRTSEEKYYKKSMRGEEKVRMRMMSEEE